MTVSPMTTVTTDQSRGALRCLRPPLGRRLASALDLGGDGIDTPLLLDGRQDFIELPAGEALVGAVEIAACDAGLGLDGGHDLVAAGLELGAPEIGDQGEGGPLPGLGEGNGVLEVLEGDGRAVAVEREQGGHLEGSLG